MAFLKETNNWEAGIYQLETTDPVLAGPDGIDNLQGKQLANRTVYLKDQIDQLAGGKQAAGNAVKLSTARNIAMSGDGSWKVAFDGSGDAAAQMTLSNSGVTPGSYGQVTVDAKGRITAARAIVPDDVPGLDWSKIGSGKPTTLAGYGIADGVSKTDLAGSLDASRTLRNVEYLKATATNGAVSRIAGINALNQLYIGDIDGATSQMLVQAAGVSVAIATKDGFQLNGMPTAPTPSANANGKQLVNVEYINAIAAGKADKTGVLRALGQPADKVDWNTLLEPGVYSIADTTFGGNHAPPADYFWGTLQVIRGSIAGSPGGLTQIFTSHRNAVTWMRAAWSENAWQSWYQVWHSGNFNPDGKADKSSTLAGYGIADGANKGGDAAQVFNVAPASQSQHAVQMSQLYGFRNRIINGDMRIDQRQAKNMVTVANWAYTIDRWGIFSTQGGSYLQAQQNLGGIKPPDGFSNYLGVKVISAFQPGDADYFDLAQAIEADNITDLAWGTSSAQPVSLQFKVYASIAGMYSGTLLNAAQTRGYAFSFNVPQANAWTTVTIPNIPGDSAGDWPVGGSGCGVVLYFNFGAGTNWLSPAGAWSNKHSVGVPGSVSLVSNVGAVFCITGVQLERGSSCSPYEVRPVGYELGLCQRYYETSYPKGVAPGVAYINGGNSNVCAHPNNFWFPGAAFKVTKRTNPSIIIYRPSTGEKGFIENSGESCPLGVSIIESDANAIGMIITSALSQGATLWQYSWSADAEL